MLGVIRAALASLIDSIHRRSSTSRPIFLAFILLVAGLALHWVVDKLLLLSTSRGYVDEFAAVFNLNRHLAEAFSLVLFVVLAFFFARVFSFSRQRRLVGIGGLMALLIANSLILWQGTKSQFFASSGGAIKCYVLTREGVTYGERAGTDPATGRQCQPVNPEVLERLQEYARGRLPQRVTSDEPVFFEPKTGQASIWYSKDASGQIEIFDLMGFHPETGEELAAVTPAAVQTWRRQQAEAAAREPRSINQPNSYVFFDPKSGAARAWYFKGMDGQYEFYDNKGYQPQTGEVLALVTRDVIADWKLQAAEKCYFVTRDAVHYGTKPGLDEKSGRECRPLTPGLRDRLSEYEKGRRPKPVVEKAPSFFDLRTGEPNIWFAKNGTGQIELFDLLDLIRIAARSYRQSTRKRLRFGKSRSTTVLRKHRSSSIPIHLRFFDPVTGQPRVWYWRSANGAWEFYDNKGFQPRTGEPLVQITQEALDAYRFDLNASAEHAKKAAARKGAGGANSSRHD